MRILVVEDEGAQREVLQYNLEAEGFAVVVADNGEDAIVKSRQLKPDLILMDLIMPVMDGVEATRRITATSPSVASSMPQ